MSISNQLTSALKVRYNSAIQATIDYNKTPCRFYFASTKLVECDACTGRQSPNPWANSGGSQNCPQCNGTGQKTVETTTDDTIAVIFDTKQFVDVGGRVVSPEGRAQTVSSISKIENIRKCSYVVFATDIEPYHQYKFTRDAEPIPIGLGSNDFVICYWKIID